MLDFDRTELEDLLDGDLVLFETVLVVDVEFVVDDRGFGPCVGCALVVHVRVVFKLAGGLSWLLVDVGDLGWSLGGGLGRLCGSSALRIVNLFRSYHL